MLPILQVGPLAIQTQGLILVLGLWIGLSLAEHTSTRFAVNPRDLSNLVFLSIISGIIGARVLYSLNNLDAFIKSPLNLFSLNPRLLDFQSGTIIGILALLIYVKQKNIQIWSILDAVTPPLGVLFIAYWLSQFAAGNAFGLETDLPWSIYLWGAQRHPTQLYFMIAGVIILGIIWPRKLNDSQIDGTKFLSFLFLASITLLFLEAFRSDSRILINNIRSTQIFAWLFSALSLYVLYQRQKISAD